MLLLSPSHKQQAVVEVDRAAESGVFVCPAPELPARRVVFSGTGAMREDHEDVRGFAEAAEKGVAR